MATAAPLDASSTPHAVETSEAVVVRFAGDSGDGMQLTGGAVHAVFGSRRQ